MFQFYIVRLKDPEELREIGRSVRVSILYSSIKSFMLPPGRPPDSGFNSI